MCQICGVNVQFFNGVPTGRAPVGTVAFDTAANYAFYVFNGGWQLVGSNFVGSFQSGGGVTSADYQAVAFFNGPPSGRAPQGQIGFDTTTNPYTIYVFSAGWQEIGVSSAPAADLLGICGPNVIFSPTNPPATPPFCLPNGTLVLPVAAGTFNGYVSQNCVLHPFGGGGAPPVFHEIFITDNSTTVFNVPLDWNNANNKIEIIGRGGTADGTIGTLGSGGSGGGGYAFADNVTLTPGSAVAVHFGFTAGETVWMKNNASVIICQAENGQYSVHQAGGAGGNPLVGTGGHPGGAGGSTTGSGGGGGGGAGSPNGPGANGGNCIGADSGAGGGGSGGGVAGNISVLTQQGANGGAGGVVGSSGGAGATYPPYTNDGGLGLLGGGGGGSGGVADNSPGGMGDGGTSNGDHCFGGVNKGACGGGGGGAGAGAGPFTGTLGGSGFNRGYGGGTGGAGCAPTGSVPQNGGCDGEIRITYTT